MVGFVRARRFLAAVGLVLVAAVPVAAGEPTDRLRTFFDRANRVILAPESEGGLEERLTAVRALVNEVFDVEGAAALALGHHWDALPPSARARFTRLYADVVDRAYLAWVGSKARVGEGGVSIRWLDETLDRDAATVTSLLLTRTGGELSVDYRLVRRAGHWLVRDVVVDGVSLAANYHVQFERVLQLHSYDELLARLRDKAGRVAREEASAADASVPGAMPAPPPAERVAPQMPTTTGATIVVARLRDAPAVVATDTPLPAPPSPAVSVPLISAPPASAVALVSRRAERTTLSPRPAPAPTHEVWVQVGAFRTIEAAAQLVQRLGRQAVTIAIGGDRAAPLARVLVGPFAERAAAVSAVRALHARGFAAFVAD
jgi:phospholipid transport system substrate-binding protein